MKQLPPQWSVCASCQLEPSCHLFPGDFDPVLGSSEGSDIAKTEEIWSFPWFLASNSQTVVSQHFEKKEFLNFHHPDASALPDPAGLHCCAGAKLTECLECVPPKPIVAFVPVPVIWSFKFLRLFFCFLQLPFFHPFPFLPTCFGFLGCFDTIFRNKNCPKSKHVVYLSCPFCRPSSASSSWSCR